jgi:hypothetical protein
MPISQWTVSQIIKQVSLRYENRNVGNNKPDPRMEWFLALDEFCQEKHFWWRRKAFSQATSVGQQTYDLSLTGAGNANAGDLAEIEELFVVNAAPQYWPCSVNPEFTAREQIGAIYGTQAVGQLIPRAGYFMLPGAFQVLQLSQPPQQVYTIAGTYYAVPMVTDTSEDTIPLVPPFLHWGLMYMYERRVAEFLLTQEDPRLVTVEKRYQDFLKSAARTKSFSQQMAIHASTSGGAVSASGGRGSHGSRSGRA